MRRLLLSAALLATGACSSGSGSVSVEGIDPFGPVVSALWTIAPPIEGWWLDGSGELEALGELSFDPLALRDYAWSCAAHKAYWERRGALSAAVLDAEGDARCDALAALYDHQASGPDAYNVLSATTPISDELPAPGPVDAAEVFGYLSYRVDDRSACPAWDAEACAFVGGDASCGAEDQAWQVEATAFTIDAASDAEVVGTLAGDLEPIDGGGGDVPYGTISAEFRAATCEVDPGPVAVFF